MGFLQFVEQVIFMPLVRYPLLGGIVLLVVFYVLLRVVWHLRLYVIRYKTILGNDYTMLEIRLPKEVERSPAAMELFFMNALHHTGGVGNPYKLYWEGRVLNSSSLEIVSFGGNIRFYLRVHSWVKNIAEAQLYAQFPQVEIVEAEDYTDRVPPLTRDADFDIFACTHHKGLSDVYPIKTYRDYGVDRHYESLDTEQQIDPLSAVIEAMGTIGPHEEWWTQILLQPKKGMGDWKQKAQDEITKLQKEYRKRAMDSDEERSTYMLTEGEKETINAIERSMDKPRFTVGIRVVYLAKTGHFNGRNIQLLKNQFTPFASHSLNELKFDPYTSFDSPWEDYRDFFDYRKKVRALEDYRNRIYFHLTFKYTWFDIYMKYINPHKYREFTMSTEELATIFHIPGGMVQAPGVERIESRKAEPPSNLPM